MRDVQKISGADFVSSFEAEKHAIMDADMRFRLKFVGILLLPAILLFLYDLLNLL